MPVDHVRTLFEANVEVRDVLRMNSVYRQVWVPAAVSPRCVCGRRIDRLGAGTYRSLLEGFIGPVSSRIHSEDRVVDAA